jgi:hypothetical protein
MADVDFDDRLRSALAHEPPPAVPVGLVDGIVAALPREGRGRPQRAWPIRLAVAVLIVLVVGVWLVGPRGSISGPPASTASGAPTASSGTSALAPTATAGLTAWTHLNWREAQVEGSGPIVAGTSWSGGYVLLTAGDAPGTNGVIWYSADGRAWERGVQSNGGKFEGMRFVGVAAIGGRLVAVAQFEGALTPAPEAVVWYSTDGAVWFPSPDSDTLFSGRSVAGIAAGPDGFVVYGTTKFGQPTRPAMLYSSDGVNWSEAVVPKGVVGEAVTSVVGTADGFAAVGGPVGSAVGTGITGAAWWSLDGQTWHPATVDSADPLYGLVRWAGGELRASSTIHKCSVCLGIPVTTTWSSADGGRNWRPLGNSLLSHTNGDTTLFDEGRLVRLQTQPASWATWSSDGVTWVPLRMDGTSPTNASPCSVSPCSAWHLILANGNTLIATGSQPVGSGGSRTEVLVGQLDDQPGPVPTPTIAPGSQDTPCKGTNPCGP